MAGRERERKKNGSGRRGPGHSIATTTAWPFPPPPPLPCMLGAHICVPPCVLHAISFPPSFSLFCVLLKGPVVVGLLPLLAPRSFCCSCGVPTLEPATTPLPSTPTRPLGWHPRDCYSATGLTRARPVVWSRMRGKGFVSVRGFTAVSPWSRVRIGHLSRE